MSIRRFFPTVLAIGLIVLTVIAGVEYRSIIFEPCAGQQQKCVSEIFKVPERKWIINPSRKAFLQERVRPPAWFLWSGTVARGEYTSLMLEAAGLLFVVFAGTALAVRALAQWNIFLGLLFGGLVLLPFLFAELHGASFMLSDGSSLYSTWSLIGFILGVAQGIPWPQPQAKIKERELFHS